MNQLLPVFCCLRQSAHNLTNYGGKALLTGKNCKEEKNEACCNEKENVLAYNGKKKG